jgi:hypothetical protein
MIQIDKGFDNLKEFYTKKAEELSARIDTYDKFEEKIDQARNELKVQKGMHDEYKKKMNKTILAIKESVGKGDEEFKAFEMKYMATRQKDEFQIDDCKGTMTKVENETKQLRAYMENRLDGVDLEFS